MHPTSSSTENTSLTPLLHTIRLSGHVLEIGFDTRTCAQHIAPYNPIHHTIIESDPHKVEYARKWATSYNNVLVMEGNWQEALPSLKTFDTIFFNERALSPGLASNEELGHLALSKGKELLSMIMQTFPQLKTLRYSDEDLDLFYQQIDPSQRKQVSYFFHELHTQGQISSAQYERTTQKYSLSKDFVTKNIFISESVSNSLFNLLTTCLAHHMAPGGRFYCCCSNPTSKYEDAQFFEHIITNSHLNYEEFFSPSDPETLIICIEKCV